MCCVFVYVCFFGMVLIGGSGKIGIYRKKNKCFFAFLSPVERVFVFGWYNLSYKCLFARLWASFIKHAITNLKTNRFLIYENFENHQGFCICKSICVFQMFVFYKKTIDFVFDL